MVILALRARHEISPRWLEMMLSILFLRSVRIRLTTAIHAQQHGHESRRDCGLQALNITRVGVGKGETHYK